MSEWLRFKAGDRVLVVGAHPWNSYAGRIVGEWPSDEMDWLVRLDNGQNIGAKTADLLPAKPSVPR